MAARAARARTEVMFGPAGHWYVYFIYGIHWMLNVVTDDVEHPAAVLIRGAGEWTGPARLTKALAIDKRLNAKPAARASGLWIEDRAIRVPRGAVRRTPRIGVDYAGAWAAKPYRFVMTPMDEAVESLARLDELGGQLHRRQRFDPACLHGDRQTLDDVAHGLVPHRNFQFAGWQILQLKLAL